MDIIDLHCDTIHRIFHEKGNLYENSYSVDIKRMLEGGVLAQFFALFVDKGFLEEQDKDIYTYTKEFYEIFINEINENQDYISLACNYEDIERNKRDKKMSAFLTIEEGDFLQGKIDRLEEFYKLGLRLITLTWNYENCIGYPNSMDYYEMKRGLKPFGFEVVEYMNELGMIIDVSHLSDGGFYDCIKHSKKPIIASHSNAREITNVPRNLSDDMIKKLADKGGVIGLNFCPHFLNSDEKSTVDSMVSHIKHIRNKGGSDVLAIGSDFDGIDGELEISHIGQIQVLIDRLKDEGFTYTDIEKLTHGNVIRVIKECLG